MEFLDLVSWTTNTLERLCLTGCDDQVGQYPWSQKRQQLKRKEKRQPTGQLLVRAESSSQPEVRNLQYHCTSWWKDKGSSKV